MTTDALTDILNDGTQPHAQGADGQSTNADIMARFDAMERKQAELEQENQELRQGLRQKGIVKGPDPALVGRPYTGAIEVMIHPATGMRSKSNLVWWKPRWAKF